MVSSTYGYWTPCYKCPCSLLHWSAGNCNKTRHLHESTRWLFYSTIIRLRHFYFYTDRVISEQTGKRLRMKKDWRKLH